VLRNLNELTAARDAFEQALKREPGFGGAHYNLGQLFERLGDPNLAIVAYTQALKHGYSSWDVWL
jgi:Tfp pilus assembly protein PilF